MKPNKLACLLICTLGLCAQENQLTIYMGGKPTATEVYSVAKSDGRIQVSGTAKAQLGTMKVSIDKFDLIEDAKFQPVSVDAQATMGQMKMAHLVKFADGKATDQITTGQATKVKEDAIHPDPLVINATLPMFAWSILALRAKVDSTDPQTFYGYVIGQGENPVSVVSKGVEQVEFAAQTAGLNHLLVTFKSSAAGEPVLADLWINDARRIIKIAVPAQSIEAYQTGFAPLPKPEAPDKDPAPIK